MEGSAGGRAKGTKEKATLKTPKTTAVAAAKETPAKVQHDQLCKARASQAEMGCADDSDADWRPRCSLGVFAEAADEGACHEVELHCFHTCEDNWEVVDLLLFVFLQFRFLHWVLTAGPDVIKF